MSKNNTTITIVKDDGYMMIEVDGHNDDPIICAGISAIMQTTELGLKSLALSTNSVTIKECETEE